MIRCKLHYDTVNDAIHTAFMTWWMKWYTRHTVEMTRKMIWHGSYDTVHDTMQSCYGGMVHDWMHKMQMIHEANGQYDAVNDPIRTSCASWYDTWYAHGCTTTLIDSACHAHGCTTMLLISADHAHTCTATHNQCGPRSRLYNIAHEQCGRYVQHQCYSYHASLRVAETRQATGKGHGKDVRVENVKTSSRQGEEQDETVKNIQTSSAEGWPWNTDGDEWCVVFLPMPACTRVTSAIKRGKHQVL